MSEAAEQSQRHIHALGSYPGAVPEVGVWLWAMEEVRGNLLATLERIERAGFGQEFIDWRGPDGNDNSVGSLLYHIARVEMGWLFFDVLGTALPADIQELLPVYGRTEDGMLRPMPDVPLADHLAKLAATRQRFLEIVSAMSLEEWNELREPPNDDYAMTMGWTVYHLVEHEAGHLYEVRRVVRKWVGLQG